MYTKYVLISTIFLLSGCHSHRNSCNTTYTSNKNNLAFNNGNCYFPSALKTSNCVNKNLVKQCIVDGIRYNEDKSYRYIEFTGGPLDIVDTCGWRYAIIDFGQGLTFNSTIIWMTKDSLRLDNYTIQYWYDQGQTWITVKEFKGVITTKAFTNSNCPIVALNDTFKTVTSSKVRFLFDNCRSYIRVTEFEVYLLSDSTNPAPF